MTTVIDDSRAVTELLIGSFFGGDDVQINVLFVD